MNEGCRPGQRFGWKLGMLAPGARKALQVRLEFSAACPPPGSSLAATTAPPVQVRCVCKDAALSGVVLQVLEGVCAPSGEVLALAVKGRTQATLVFA